MGTSLLSSSFQSLKNLWQPLARKAKTQEAPAASTAMEFSGVRLNPGCLWASFMDTCGTSQQRLQRRLQRYLESSHWLKVCRMEQKQKHSGMMAQYKSPARTTATLSCWGHQGVLPCLSTGTRPTSWFSQPSAICQSCLPVLNSMAHGSLVILC